MHYAFPFLPLEVQTSIKELASLGMPESAVDLLIERTAKALEDKTTRAQRQVVDIEQSMERRVDKIGEKLADDLRSVLGETNGMLVDIHTTTQAQEAAVRELRAEFQAFGEAVSERLTSVEGRADVLEQKVAEHDQSRDRSIQDRLMLREDMDESKAHRARMQERLDTDLPAIFNQLASLSEAVRRMEQTLELGGNYQRNGGGDG